MKIKRLILLFFLTTNFAISQENNNLDFKNLLILVDVKIKNETFKFLFDTGAETSVFFDIQNKISIKKGQYFLAEDGFNNIDTMYFPKKDIKIYLPEFNISGKGNGGLIISKKIPEKLKIAKIYGILGNNFISKFDWVYDVTNNKIKIVTNESEINRVDYFNFSFNEKNLISCNYTTDNGCVFKDTFLLDTGFYGNVCSKPITIDCYSSFLDNINKVTTAATNEIKISKIIKSNFEIGNFKVVDLPTTIYSNDNAMNLVGISFLRMFKTVYFLFSEKKILLEKQNNLSLRLFSPTIFNGKINGYLEGMNQSSKNLFKKWTIDSEVNINNNDFEFIDYPIKFIEFK